MKRIWIILLGIMAIIFGATIGLIIYENNNGNDNSLASENRIEEISESISDECTQEYENMKKDKEIDLQANASNEIISPNCLMTLQRHYNKCGHTTNEYIDVPEELINMNKDELENEYSDWVLKEYSPTQIILYKEFEGNCDEHFILRDDKGKVVINKITENGEEELYEKTEIDTEYLTETDKIELKNGITVNGLEKLNELIEDYE